MSSISIEKDGRILSTVSFSASGVFDSPGTRGSEPTYLTLGFCLIPNFGISGTHDR